MLNLYKIKMEVSMKAIIVLMISSTLFFTAGCNYDYGKYGKDKKETNAEQSKDGETNSN